MKGNSSLACFASWRENLPLAEAQRTQRKGAVHAGPMGSGHGIELAAMWVLLGSLAYTKDDSALVERRAEAREMVHESLMALYEGAPQVRAPPPRGRARAPPLSPDISIEPPIPPAAGQGHQESSPYYGVLGRRSI